MPDQLSSYIAVNADGSVAAYFGKMDMGQGLFVAIGQIVAEELDVPFEAVTVYMGDTATSVNQGGASGSTGLQEGGKQMRVAAAEARRVLVQMASDKLAVPFDQLTVSDGVVHATADAGKKVSYAELVGGKFFNVHLDWNGKFGNPLYAPGKAQPKDPKDHKIVGQPIKREDIAPKVFAQQDFCTDVKVSGHGAWPHDPARRRGCGAREGRRELDQGHPDRASRLEQRLPRRRRRQGMGCDPGGRGSLRSSGRTRRRRSPNRRRFTITSAARRRASARSKARKPAMSTTAFKSAARVIEAEYEWPFQSHACMGPACALVEIKDGHVTCWSGTQKSHFVRAGVAAILQMPRDNVRVIWTTGPGSYGRNDADDCAMDAAVLAKAVGRPVRLQYMRDQGTGWDPKAPASIHKVRAALDASGNVVAWDFLSKGFSRVDVNTNGSNPRDTLAGQTLGVALQSGDGFGVPEQSYGFANKRTAWETIAPLLDRASPLRTRAYARSGRAANPFRQRILHGRSGRGAEHGPRRIPPALCQGRRATLPSSRRRRRKPAGRRGRRRARTRPAIRCPAAASPTHNAAGPAWR